MTVISSLPLWDEPPLRSDQHGHIVYNCAMRSVNISSLKARLSAHIRMVRNGEEVLVCDRNKPVARLIPCSPAGQPSTEKLIARGILKAPLKKRSSTMSWPRPPGNITAEAMQEIWRQERDEF